MMKNLYIYFSGAYNDKNDIAIVKGNLGDMFGYYIVKELIKRHNLTEKINLIPINHNTPNAQIKSGKILLLVGSIINHIPRIKTNNEVIIIGCGNINGDIIQIPNNVNILGVRGYLTKKKIVYNKDVSVISDPGLLLSEIFTLNKRPTKKIGYIIHSVDRALFFQRFPQLKSNLINNYQSPEQFINELLDYEKIISSSLHGIIFAHSFKKDVAAIKVSNKIIGGNFKFQDYYSSLNINNFTRFNLSSINNFSSLFLKNEKISNDIINSFKQIILEKITNFLIKHYE